jgi:hypothetical protein
MRSRWFLSACGALGLFLFFSMEPTRCGVPPIHAQGARLLPAIIITEGETTQGYPYLFGGVSSNEREVMEARAKDYNLRLVFAAKSGAYVSGVMVVLATANGAEIISVATTGPWFYIQLPPGNYSVKASIGGDTKQIKNLRLVKDRSLQQILTWDLGEQAEP